MDRIKARSTRGRSKFGTRLRYTAQPAAQSSPSAAGFIVERRLPKNYKTIKTSSRSTVATSSSLSTFQLEEDIDTGRNSPYNGFEFNQIPRQAFNTNRDYGETAVEDSFQEESRPYENEKPNEGNFNPLPDTKRQNSKKDQKSKASGYDIEKRKDEELDIKLLEKPKKENKKTEDKDTRIEDKDDMTSLADDGNGHDDKLTTKHTKSRSKEEHFVQGEENNQTTKLPEVFTSMESEKKWQPVVTKPKTGGAEDPKEKCLNECGKCGKSEMKLKLLPCLHSFCLPCLKTQVYETYRKMIRCVLCGSKTVVPSAGLDSLENNYYFHFSEFSLSETEKCDLCYSETPSSRCTECNLNLCSECVKEHLSISDRSHYIVNVSVEMIGRAPWNAICTRHNPFTLELFCINCSQLICGRCVLETHNNHVTENAEMYAREKRREFETKLSDSNTAKLVSSIDDHVKLLKKERENIQKDIDKTVEAIKIHVSILKTKLDAFCEQAIGDLNKKGNIYTQSFDKKIDSSLEKRKATHISLETLKQIVHRTRDIDFISKYSSLIDTLTDMQQDNRLDIIPRLEISYISLLDSLNNSVGRVNVHAQLTKELMLLEEASVQFPRHVTTVYPVDNVRAWVGFRKNVQQCTKDGTVGLRIGVGDYVVSIDKSSGDTIYIACRTRVQALTGKLQLKHLFSLPHEPSDMKFNRMDEMIIAFRDARRVALFSNRGSLLKEFDIRHFGYRFGVRLNDPWKIAITDNYDILLSDYTSEHVAVFDDECEMKSTFRSNVYKQGSISYDGGLVYIVDYKRDSLNIFSEDGYLLQRHQLEGLKSPSCIAVKSGSVWIGSWNGLVKCYHVK